MSQYGDTQEDRLKVLEYELDLIFNSYGIGGTKRTREEFLDFRLKANDLEDVESKVAEIILNGTDIKEEDEEFQTIVELTIYNYYLMLHCVAEYLEIGEFTRLTDKSFEYVWGKISQHDKAEIIGMVLFTEDDRIIVSGMYLLLAQIERKERGIVE